MELIENGKGGLKEGRKELEGGRRGVTRKRKGWEWYGAGRGIMGCHGRGRMRLGGTGRTKRHGTDRKGSDARHRTGPAGAVWDRAGPDRTGSPTPYPHSPSQTRQIQKPFASLLSPPP